MSQLLHVVPDTRVPPTHPDTWPVCLTVRQMHVLRVVLGSLDARALPADDMAELARLGVHDLHDDELTELWGLVVREVRAATAEPEERERDFEAEDLEQ